MASRADSPFVFPLAIMFFGVSGSGKGTQAELLKKAFEEADPSRACLRAEMGSLLRAFVKEDNTLASGIEKILAAGALVPSFIPSYLLTQYLAHAFHGTEHLILDGVARRPIQSKLVNQIVKFWGSRPRHSIVLELSRESARQRLIARGRADDATPEAIDRRFGWYEKEVLPSIEMLERLGWKTHRVNGEGDIESIHREILQRLGFPAGAA